MRLTAVKKATVVRGVSGRQARGLAGAENESGNGGFEGCPVLAQEAVMALHPPFSRFQDAEALIFVYAARHYGRLFAPDPLADDFGIHALAHRVVDQPAPRKELRGHRSDVLDANEIRKDIMALR